MQEMNLIKVLEIIPDKCDVLHGIANR